MSFTFKPLHIIVGMSGGVDSSVAAYLLKKAGHHVEGVFMKNWEDDAHCQATQDLKDAQQVADVLKIDLHAVNFAEEYWQRVFTHFLAEYQAGRTPNPDILCNKEIKFRAFLDYAKQRGAEAIATGHYVRRFDTQQGSFLLKGKDEEKDQSYFLYALNATQIAQSLFPIGDLPKREVRALAKEIGLNNHHKKDSTGICFIGERKFKTFLNDYLPAKPGPINTLEGEYVGQHDGLMFYTIGQRQGLKIGGQAGKPESPWYVVDKDIAKNQLIVIQGANHPALFKKSLLVSQLHWIHAVPDRLCNLTARIRYRQKDQACKITSASHHQYHVQFTVPQRAVTPGQSIVFYQGDICLGGGIIV